ncbi:uncharacterized protein LOC124921867 [Impatiens glandulifera]|uniref:uncharacterized protein LOC124921867 n=1 Tax=Impatiens glandulifera TaxID=253017 RepID=UPI001FB15AAF|nr:uncharacterized protein LOC124921867 [Impatiens glandulifera]XP_047318524.1 uncharacterized protein LOC124921867 [Impatiens glandulifera]
MVSIGTISSSSTLVFSPVLNSDSRSSSLSFNIYTQSLSTFSPLVPPCRISNIHPRREIPVRFRRISAVPEDSIPVQANPVEKTQEIVVSSGSGNVEATIIQTLLIIAFISLSILTIGVIYIGVTDFLQKREKEKFEKEESAKKKGKKSDKKPKVSRAGPKGFGQVKKEDEDFDD